MAAVVMLIGSVAGAQTVVFDEPFTGTTGDEITTLGWTQIKGRINVASELVDAGQSAGASLTTGIGDWSVYTKPVVYDYSSGKDVTLSWKSKTEETTGDASGSNNNDYVGAMQLGLFGATGQYRIGFSGWNGNLFATVNGTNVGTVAAVEGNDFEYQISFDHTGNPLFEYTVDGGSLTTLATAGSPIGNLEKIELWLLQDDNAPSTPHWLDSINITAVPEPSTVVMLLGGLLGLVAYAVRRKSR